MLQFAVQRVSKQGQRALHFENKFAGHVKLCVVNRSFRLVLKTAAFSALTSLPTNIFQHFFLRSGFWQVLGGAVLTAKCRGGRSRYIHAYHRVPAPKLSLSHWRHCVTSKGGAVIEAPCQPCYGNGISFPRPHRQARGEDERTHASCYERAGTGCTLLGFEEQPPRCVL